MPYVNATTDGLNEVNYTLNKFEFGIVYYDAGNANAQSAYF